ncbi:unnamed protein product [Porites lobata]|uniref:RING-type E3 ubiquitin transferase n=1 Tax=Porites lobata TaxID=104759 RepID=A0ABN8S8D4_9CNID|nr:unnamed protein product [Porites lobata]
MTDFGRSNGPLDFKLCVICQEKSTANLVENPTSHQKLLEAIEERSKYEDINSKTLWLVLKDLPLEELKEKAKTFYVYVLCMSCYQETTHSGKIKRVKERFQREVRGPNEAQRKTSESLQGLLTRSKTAPYDSNLCFFCEEKAKYQNPLHLVSTSSAGSSLDKAVKQSKDPKLLVKLSAALDSTDAHTIDIKYHKSCWAKHVTGVLRKTIKDDEERSRSETAVKLEFFNLTQAALDSGEILNMAQLEEPNDSCRSVTELSESLTSLMPCVGPPSRPPSPAYPTFELSSEQELPQNIRDENATWIVSRTLTGHDAPSDDDNDQPPVPVWSA